MQRIFQQLGLYLLLTVWSYAVQAAHPTPATEHDRVNRGAAVQAMKAEAAIDRHNAGPSTTRAR